MERERFLLFLWLPVVLGLYEIGMLDMFIFGIVFLGFLEILYRYPHSKITIISMIHMTGFLFVLILKEHDVWFILLVVASNDGASFFVGSQLCSKFSAHPFPRISPNKTIGGYFFGIIAGTISGIIIAKYFKLPHHYNFLAFVACLLAISGDLLNSKFKRSHEIKDSGQGLFTENLLPGHGGIYDRFDSISLACISWVFLGILGFI